MALAEWWVSREGDRGWADWRLDAGYAVRKDTIRFRRFFGLWIWTGGYAPPEIAREVVRVLKARLSDGGLERQDDAQPPNGMT